jgi:hypothetical protein
MIRMKLSVFAVLTITCALLTSTAPAFAQSNEPAPAPAPEPEPEPTTRPFRLGGEAKFGIRNSRDLQTPVRFPFPPNFIPPGQDSVYLRTVSPGTSFELVNVAVIGEGDLSSGVAAKIEVHFLDLYNRNPTSSDDRVFVREAWLRIGHAFGPLEPVSGTSGYLLVGMAPRFSKPLVRRLESYGLWTTAVGRFENPQVQIGGTFGRHVYWRGAVGNGNPVFIRDTNVLAGDNGTPERVPNPTTRAPYESGFPILYDAKPQDLNPNGKFEYGVGGGFAASGDVAAFDVLGWMFRRDLAEAAKIRGTFYSGDIKLLRGAGFPLPFSGNDKIERGVNINARLGGLRVFGQYVDQEIAKLPRRGYEVETAYHIPLNGLFLLGETPVMNWLQPVLRVSYIDNKFDKPREYPAPSVDWDWTKFDMGARLGITDQTDFTIEYSYHNMKTGSGMKHPNETLATFRVGF